MWFAISVVLAGAPLLAALWAPGLLPLLDWPEHLAFIAELAINDGPRGARRFLEPDVHIAPYLGFYLPAVALVKLGVSVESAARLVLSSAVIATPFATARLLRALERPAWPALLALTLGYSTPLTKGFAAFVVSVPVFVLALSQTELTLREPTRARGFGLAALSTWLFFTHAFSFQCLLVAALFQWASHPRRSLRAAWVLGLALFPATLLHTAWMLRDMRSLDAYSAGTGRSQFEGVVAPGAALERTELSSLKEKLKLLPTAFVEVLPSYMAWLWIPALAVDLALAAYWHRRREALSAWRGGAWRPWGLCALFFALFFALPVRVAGVWWVAPRVITLLGCLVPALVPAWGARWRWRWVAALPAAALVCFGGLSMGARFRDFQREVRGLRETLGALGAGQRVYPLIFDPRTPRVAGTPLLHLGAYATVWRGAVCGVNFLHNQVEPMRTRGAAPLLHLGKLGDYFPWRFDPAVHGPFYDAVLVQWREGTPPPPPLRWGWTLRARHGHWALLGNPRPHPGVAVDALREHPARVRPSLEVAGEGERACVQAERLRWDCEGPGRTWVAITELSVARRRAPCVRVPVRRGAVTRLRFERLLAPGDALHGYVGYTTREGPGDHDAAAVLRVSRGSRLLGEVSVARGRAQPFSFALSREDGLAGLEVEARTEGARPVVLCFNAFVYDSRL